MITDGTARHFVDGEPVTLLAKLGTFAEHTVRRRRRRSSRSTTTCRSTAVALVSCGVATGWGSAVKRAEVAARRHRRGGRHRRHRHQRRAGRQRWPAPSASSPSTRSSSSGRRRWSSAPPTRSRRWRRRIPRGHRADVGPDGRQGDHDPGRDVRRPDGARPRRSPARAARCVVTAVAPIDADRRRRSTCSSWRCGNKEIKGTIFGSLNPRADIPKPARPVPRGPAQARRADHQPLPARRDQRRLPGDARRQEHPRRHRAWSDSMPESSATVARRAPRVDRSSGGEREIETRRRRAGRRPPHPARGPARHRQVDAAARRRRRARRRLRVRRGQRRAHAGPPGRPLRPGPGAGRGLRPRRVRRRTAGRRAARRARCCTSRRSTASPRRRSTCSSR